MFEMQKFYENKIAVDQPNPYSLLAQAAPEDILTDDLLVWTSW